MKKYCQERIFFGNDDSSQVKFVDALQLRVMVGDFGCCENQCCDDVWVKMGKTGGRVGDGKERIWPKVVDVQFLGAGVVGRVWLCSQLSIGSSSSNGADR